jgi:hypothetical protein
VRNSIRSNLAIDGINLSRSRLHHERRAIRLSPMKIAFLAVLLAGLFAIPLGAQTFAGDQQREGAQNSSLQLQSGSDNVASEAASRPSQAPQDPLEQGRQPKRILWVIPNYRAVSANTQLPPLAPRQKLWLATEDSFDYSSFALAAIVAGISQAGNSIPEFGHGGTAYGRYLWHTFTDEAVGNYFTEALVPIATRQDPRYYTLGRSGGGFWRRTGYSLTRLVITRVDSGPNTFNSSEIVGNLAGQPFPMSIIRARNAPGARPDKSG